MLKFWKIFCFSAIFIFSLCYNYHLDYIYHGPTQHFQPLRSYLNWTITDSFPFISETNGQNKPRASCSKLNISSFSWKKLYFRCFSFLQIVDDLRFPLHIVINLKPALIWCFPGEHKLEIAFPFPEETVQALYNYLMLSRLSHLMPQLSLLIAQVIAS